MINAYDGPKTEPWFDDFGDFNTVRPQGDALYKESMREMSDKIVEDYMAKEEVGMKFDTDKPRYDLEQVRATEEVINVLTFGAKKYADDNWRLVEDADKRYYAGARRHMAEYKQGVQIDPESGRHVLAHAICCLNFLLEIELENKQ